MLNELSGQSALWNVRPGGQVSRNCSKIVFVEVSTKDSDNAIQMEAFQTLHACWLGALSFKLGLKDLGLFALTGWEEAS